MKEEFVFFLKVDTAGKSSTIKFFSEYLMPKSFRYVMPWNSN